MSTIEYRKLFRADITVDIRWRFKSSSSDEYFGLSKNLSATGIQMIIDKEIERETLIQLNIYLSSGAKPIQFTGSVVWQVECDYAPKGKTYYSTRVKFLQASSKDIILISDFITSILKKQTANREKEIIENLEKSSK